MRIAEWRFEGLASYGDQWPSASLRFVFVLVSISRLTEQCVWVCVPPAIMLVVDYASTRIYVWLLSPFGALNFCIVILVW